MVGVLHILGQDPEEGPLHDSSFGAWLPERSGDSRYFALRFACTSPMCGFQFDVRGAGLTSEVGYTGLGGFAARFRPGSVWPGSAQCGLGPGGALSGSSISHQFINIQTGLRMVIGCA